MGFDVLQNFSPVSPRQVQVQQNQIRAGGIDKVTLTMQKVQGIGSVRDRYDLMSDGTFPQRGFNAVQMVSVIFHDQNQPFFFQFIHRRYRCNTIAKRLNHNAIMVYEPVHLTPSMSSMNRYYEILGLQPGSSPADVKQAYRTLAKTWHPDRFTHDPVLKRQAEEKLKAINEAYHQLKDFQPPQVSSHGSPAPASHSSARTTVSSKPTNAEFWYNRGAENASLGRYKDALEDFSMAIKLNPKYAEAYRYRGFAHSMLGFELGAESDLRQAKVLELEQKRAAERSQSARDQPNPTSAPKSRAWNWKRDHPAAQPAAPPTPPKVGTWDAVQTWHDHTEAISAIALSRDGKFLVSGSWDATVKFWNLRTGMVFHTLTQHAGPITAIALSLNGELLATASHQTIKLWDLKMGNLLRTLSAHTDPINALAISPDNYELVSGGQDGRVCFWNLKSKRLDPVGYQHGAPILSIAISPDGQLAMSGGADHILTVHQARTGEQLRSLVGHPAGLTSIAISADGKRFATGGEDGTIAMWSETAIVTGNLDRIWVAHTGVVRSLTFSPDGRILASSGDDATIRLWNPMGERLATLSGHRDRVNAIVFSGSGQTLLSGSADKTIRLWQQQT